MAFAFAVVVVVAASDVTGGGDDASDERLRAAGALRADHDGATNGRRRRSRSAHTRCSWATASGSIAEKTGVDVETIQLLNPELDPQSLTVGQKIKLRE